MRGAASAERTRIARELAKLERDLERLDRQTSQLRTRRLDLSERLRALNLLTPDDLEAAGERQPAPIAAEAMVANATPGPGAILRGAHIREFAVRILIGMPQGRAAVHYRSWYRLLFDRGIRVSGRDPEASFLTQISRSPVVERADKPGTYRINYRYPAEARSRLDMLRIELEATYLTAQSSNVEALADVGRQRAQLESDIAKLERRLQEALRSLGESQSDGRKVA